MFVENAYPNDTRVRNEAETLTEAGYSVTVVCLRKKGQPRSEMVNGVQAYRLPRLELFQKTPADNPTLFQRVWLKVKSLVGYVSEYVYFTSACGVMSIYVAFKHGFDVIHAHNPPDTLWVVALPWRLLGKKVHFRPPRSLPRTLPFTLRRQARFSGEGAAVSGVGQSEIGRRYHRHK